MPRICHALSVMPCLSVETLILFDDLTVRKRAYAALDYLKRGHRAKNSSLSLSLSLSLCLAWIQSFRSF